MSKRIYKYHLQFSGLGSRVVVGVFIPYGAKFLTAREIKDDIFMWYTIDVDAPIEMKYFTIIGTGHPFLKETDKQLHTWFVGEYVWHLMETQAP